MKLSSVTNWTHKIILTVYFNGTKYILQNSNIETNHQSGRPKHIREKPRGVASKLYVHQQSDTNINSQIDCNFDNSSASFPINAIGEVQGNKYSLESLLAAADSERINLEQLNQQDQQTNRGLCQSTEINIINKNKTENMDSSFQREALFEYNYLLQYYNILYYSMII